MYTSKVGTFPTDLSDVSPSITGNKPVILIPYFIHNTLKRNGLNLSECLDLLKLREYFSIEDLAIFSSLNSVDGFLAVFGGKKEFYYGDSNFISMTWCKNVDKIVPEKKENFQNTLSLINRLESWNDTSSRLFSKDCIEVESDVQYEVHDFESGFLGVVIYPGKFINNDIGLHKSLISDVLDVFYAYLKFHEVARSAYFRRYLELLS